VQGQVKQCGRAAGNCAALSFEGGQIENAGSAGTEINTSRKRSGGAEKVVIEEIVLLDRPPGVGVPQRQGRSRAVGVEDRHHSMDRSAALRKGGAGHQKVKSVGLAGKRDLDALLIRLPKREQATVRLDRIGGCGKGDLKGAVKNSAGRAQAGVIDRGGDVEVRPAPQQVIGKRQRTKR